MVNLISVLHPEVNGRKTIFRKKRVGPASILPLVMFSTLMINSVSCDGKLEKHLTQEKGRVRTREYRQIQPCDSINILYSSQRSRPWRLSFTSIRIDPYMHIKHISFAFSINCLVKLHTNLKHIHPVLKEAVKSV